MHSILFRIGPIPVYAYGFMLMLAFLAGSTVAVRLARRRGIPAEQVLDLSAWILVVSIVGARLLYVALQWSYFRENPGHIWHIWEGGLSFHGGLAGGLLAGAIYCRRHRLSFHRMGDVVAPGVALGYSIARIGCFLNGCCYGAPTDLPWACRFHDPPITGPLTPPSHPTQIYASIVNLGIFAVLLLIWRRQRATGQVLWSYLLLYAVYRFGIEFLRKGATAQVFAAGLTHSQWVSIATLLVAVAVLFRLSRRGEEVGPTHSVGTRTLAAGNAPPDDQRSGPRDGSGPGDRRPIGAAGKK